MNRSMRVALGVVLVALAVPTVALATHHPAGGFRHHGHHHGGLSTGGPGATGAGNVQNYDGQTGALTLLLPGGDTITGTVTDRTRFECPHDSQGRGWGHGGRAGAACSSPPTRGPSGPGGNTGASGSTGSSGDTGSSGSTGLQRQHRLERVDRIQWQHRLRRGSTGDTGTGGSRRRAAVRPPPPPLPQLIRRRPVRQLAAHAGRRRTGRAVELNINGVFFEELEFLPAVQ